MNSKMHSAFVKEQKRYTQNEIRLLLGCTEEKSILVIRKLKEYGVLKAVKKDEIQKNLTELQEEDIQVASVELGNDDYYYVFTFVGVIVISGIIIKSYPKYINNKTNPVDELKLIIKTLEKYSNSKNEIIRMYNDTTNSSSFNLLAVILFLLSDYNENGLYTNEDRIIETNGMGDILWDRTINDTFTLISNNRPYYPEIQTVKNIEDDSDYFKRLHECVLSLCSEELVKTDLTSIFDDIIPAFLSEEELDSFGDKDYILYRIENELSVQFNTHKQLILKTIYAYIKEKSTLSDIDCFSMFGTNSFEEVWEEIFRTVLDDKLHKKLNSIILPKPLNSKYNKNDELISIIEKPKWHGLGWAEPKEGNTLIPDIISIQGDTFIISDAKYYVPVLDENKPLCGQPGIESITKQYLYQLAYKNFIDEHGFKTIKNCFLMPTEEDNVINKGVVYMNMLNLLGLESIEVRMVPANELYKLYITSNKYDLNKLKL